MIDSGLRLSGTTAGVGQDLASVTTAGALSTNWLDRDEKAASLGDGRPLYVKFTTTTSLNSSTENATVELQIVALPLTTIATFTTTGDTDIAATVITEAGHGLTVGTRLTVASSGSFGSPLAASTSYYVVEATTDTFKISTTPDGAAISITDQASVTYTWTWHPEVLVSSGPIGLDRLQANKSRVTLVLPPAQATPRYPRNRYLFARYVPSATLTAGGILADIWEHPPTSSGTYPQGGY